MTEIASRNRFVTGAQVADLNGADAPAIPLPRKEEATAIPADLDFPADAAPAPQMLDAGKALAISDFVPPDISMAERMVRFAYRLGIPGPALAAPFRKPAKPRLLATVQSPLKGNATAGTALRAGHFLVYGTKFPIPQVDFSPSAPHAPALERVIHGFTWLRDLEACAPRAQGAPTAERILAAWLDASGKPGKGQAWKAGHAGTRLLGWFVHAPLILGGNDKRLRSRVLASMEETARWLDRNASRADDKAEELEAWCAIVAAGLLLPDGKPRRLHGEAGLTKVMGELVGADGGVLSRSPVVQMEVISSLVELAACYRATRRDCPQAVDSMLHMLVPPLLALTHGDGGIGCWQGSGAISAEAVSNLVAATGVRARPLREAREWGYQRAVAGKSVLQFDAAPPPLARHARHGCASTLAFELSHGAHRLVVNCGGAALAGGQVPMRIEQGLRATAAHSTLVLGDANSTAVLVAGKLGAGVGEVEMDRRVITGDAAATRLEASHDGYAGRFGLVHRRILMLRDDGTELRGEDLLVPAGRKGKRGKVPYAIRFHLGPMVEVTPSETGRGATLALPDGSYWQFVAGEGTLEIDESLWVDGDGRPNPAQQLVMQGMVSRGGGTFSWLLKKIR